MSDNQKRDDPLAPYQHLLCGAFDVSPSAGWMDLVERMLGDIDRIDPTARILQIKSKFGELRVAFATAPKAGVSDIVRAAEEESVRTCEICGAPGRRRGGSWIATLCDDHAKKGAS